jgi:hypothetical protein
MPKRRTTSKKTGSKKRSPLVIAAAILVVVIGIGYYTFSTGADPLGLLSRIGTILTGTAAPPATSTGDTAAVVSGKPGALPDLATKPTPKEITFKGCPPGGDGGDTIQNSLKNRVDEGNYVPVSFDALLSLAWPKTTERRDRVDWSAQDTAAIAKYEGIPVTVEGYLAAATESGPESTNCHGTSHDMSDWHVSLVKNAGEDRTKAIVTETTPRVRPNHQWSLDLLKPIIANQEQVRISGWVFFDPEHPDHLGKYRATLWEIHPIMQIEVYRNGQWINLDSVAAPK